MRKVNFYTTDGVKEIEGKCIGQINKTMYVFEDVFGDQYFRVVGDDVGDYLIKIIDNCTYVGMSPESYNRYRFEIAEFEEQQTRMTYQQFKEKRG